MSRNMLVPITTYEPNIDRLIVDLFKLRGDSKHIITNDVIYYLCQKIRMIFMGESVVLDLKATTPIVIVGDIHGQYYDLIRHLNANGIPPNVTYVFLGDYVDRGKYSIEVLCLLYALKIKYPNHIYLLRGDHECARMNRRGGFYDECIRKTGNLYSWNAFVSTFNVMPFAAIIDENYICVHAGISPLLHSVSQLRKIERPLDIPKEGLICDIVWSDYDEEIIGFCDNERREISVVFGKDLLATFLKENGLKLMIRGHEVANNGFLVEEYCITVFSACQYRGSFDNSAATVIIEKDKINFKVIEAV
ncbi:serine/threonine protein phosphatase PP1-2 [Entamoeba marina]